MMDPVGLGADDALPEGLVLRPRVDADVEAVVELWNRHAPPTEVQTAAGFRRWEAINPMPNRLDLVVTEAGGALVAQANVGDGGVWAQADHSYRGHLLVERASRRRGVGRLLARRLEAYARAKGASRINARVRGDEPEALAFAVSLGYAEYHRRYNSYLEVPAFDASTFEAPDAVAARAGVRLATFGEAWAERTADEEAFLRHLYDVNGALTKDVPFPDPFEPPPFDFVRKHLFGSPTLDRNASILALRDGKVVALTFTDVNESGIAYTFMTGVARTERGKGLALALKLRAIAALRARGVRWLGTTNDEANAPMRGINRRLGYQTQPASIQVRKLFA